MEGKQDRFEPKVVGCVCWRRGGGEGGRGAGARRDKMKSNKAVVALVVVRVVAGGGVQAVPPLQSMLKYLNP